MRKETWSFLITVSFVMLGANPAQADSPPPNPGPPPPQLVPAECKAVLVRSIEHVAIEPGTPPKIVASGTVSTAGWKDPQLRFRSITKFKSRDASAVYAFVACPPESGAEVLTPITAETILNLSPQLGRVYHLVVEAATNRVTLDPDAPPKH
jgi:hypothetical protein